MTLALDRLYTVADDRPPVTLRALIAHAIEVRRSNMDHFDVLRRYPHLWTHARDLRAALDEDVHDLHQAAQTFAVSCLRAARHRPAGSGKATNGRARDRLKDAQQARENRDALQELQRKVAGAPPPTPTKPGPVPMPSLF